MVAILRKKARKRRFFDSASANASDTICGNLLPAVVQRPISCPVRCKLWYGDLSLSGSENTIAFRLSPGSCHDDPLAREPVPTLDENLRNGNFSLLTDKAYESDQVRSAAVIKGLSPVVPPKENRKVPPYILKKHSKNGILRSIEFFQPTLSINFPNKPLMYDKILLQSLIMENALKFGDFTLASGKKAQYYLDCRQVTLDSVGARLIGEGILEMLQVNPVMPQAVGGMAIGADPITAAVITVAAYRNIPLKGFMVRKQAKGHGTGRFVEGPVGEGDHVVIVEDVVTTGGSSLDAIERVEAVGAIVDGVIAIIDRLEGGNEAFQSKGYLHRSLFTVRDFGIEPVA